MFNKRKKYFKKEMKKINRIIEELPFKYEVVEEGKRMIREGIRQQYDKQKEIIDGASTRMKEEKEKEKWDKLLLEQMTKIVAQGEVELEQFEKQMEELDRDIGETAATRNQKVEAARSYRMIVINLFKK